MSGPKPKALISPGFSFALILLASVAFSLSLPAIDYLSAERSTATLGILLLFTIELPLYYWLIVLRRSGTHPLYALPVAALGYLFCRWWTLGETSDWITWGGLALAPLEVLLIVMIARRVSCVVRTSRQQPRSFDLIERLSLAAGKEFPANRWMAVLAYEVGLIHYALGGRSGIQLGSKDVAFTYHRRSGIRLIYAVALVIGAAEVTGLHLLVAAYSPQAAWVLTGFELYGLIWMIGLLRSISELPIVVGERGIQVRLGVMYTLFVPYDAIESVMWQQVHVVDSRPDNYLNCAFMNAPDCVLKLRTHMQARLPYTLSKRVNEIGLMVDEPGAFQAQLEQRMTERRGCRI